METNTTSNVVNQKTQQEKLEQILNTLKIPFKRPPSGVYWFFYHTQETFYGFPEYFFNSLININKNTKIEEVNKIKNFILNEFIVFHKIQSIKKFGKRFAEEVLGVQKNNNNEKDYYNLVGQAMCNTKSGSDFASGIYENIMNTTKEYGMNEVITYLFAFNEKGEFIGTSLVEIVNKKIVKDHYELRLEVNYLCSKVEGNGSGRRILERLKKFSEYYEPEHFEIEIIDATHDAIPFYLHLGFQPEKLVWSKDNIEKTIKDYCQTYTDKEIKKAEVRNRNNMEEQMIEQVDNYNKLGGKRRKTKRTQQKRKNTRKNNNEQ